jgi:glycosyltransferase involved in cell wall biosynthesis
MSDDAARVKRRILLYASSGGAHGGVEAFVAALFHQLRQEGEFEVKVLLKVRGDCLLEQSLFDLFARDGIRPEIFRLNLAALAVAVWQSDLVHGNYPAGYLGLICGIFRKPWVLTVHNWKRTKVGVIGWLEDLCLHGARRRWYNSGFVAGTWERGSRRVGSAVVPTVSDLPDLWIAPEERKGFVFAARWVPGKGLEELIEAYALADLDREEHPLVLLGDGLLRGRANDLLQRFGAAGITTPGFLTGEAKTRCIARARWMVAPTQSREELGLTPIEARCCGVPSIVTRDGGLPEAAGDAGIVIARASISDLRDSLLVAARMSPGAYAERARIAKESLASYLKPLSFYAGEYRDILHSSSTAA